MTASTNSRTAILKRIYAATSGPANNPLNHTDIKLNYTRHGSLTADARLSLMTHRLHEYGADVVECAPAELSACITNQLRASGRRKFVTPSGLSFDGASAGFVWIVDRGLHADEIEHADGVVTESFCGIADSGTIVLHHSDHDGRRVTTLLPDWHLCILRASQIVETLPEYFDRCSEHPALATYISGPSATADIEMTRIKGVHGPRFLTVILVQDES